MRRDAVPPRRIAVLDIGKTNVKTVLFAEGAEAFTRTMPNMVLQKGPYPHYDVPRIQAFFLDALADLQRDSGFDAVSVTAHGAAGALLRGTELALPVLDYEHAEPDRLAGDYDRVRPPFQESFSPRLPGGLNLGAQLFWQAECFPDAFESATSIVTYPQYWSGWLTGVAATEPTSLGAHTDLWAPREGRFSSMVHALGWTSKLAPLRSAFEILGPIRPDLARSIGLGKAVPVACGIHDSNASLLPHLQAEAGRFAVVSTGTWVIAFAVGGDLDQLDPARDMLANVDAWSRPVPAARFMGGREFDMLAGGTRGTVTPEAIAGVFAAGIMALPSFVPGNGPFPQAAGRWSHDPATLTDEQRFVAASLYAALMTVTCLTLLAAEGDIVVEGPFAKNSLFCDALELLAGYGVHAAEGGTGTSGGAAALIETAKARSQRHDRQNALRPHRTALSAYATTWRAACPPPSAKK